MPAQFVVSRSRQDPVALFEHLEPVVEPADHHRDHGRHARDVLARLLAAMQPALDGLGERDRLRNREADGRVDVHAGRGEILGGLGAGPGRRHLHLHVGRESGEAKTLLGDAGRVAVELRVGLDREAPLQAILPLEDGEQDLGAPDGHLLVQLPGDLVLGPGRVLGDDLVDPVPPEVHLLLEHLPDDRRVARRPGRPARDGIGELLDRAGVVPEVGRGRRGHLPQRACSHLGGG